MRAQADEEFSSYLLAIGDGIIPPIKDDIIPLLHLPTLPYEGISSLDQLINVTFPDLNTSLDTLGSFLDRAILSTKNEFVDEINEIIIEKFEGEVYEYKSFDASVHQGYQTFQEDLFNSMTPSDFPPHILKLKKNCPVILLRNIDPSKGLCNGTRLICKSFTKNLISAEIASGIYKGNHVFLPMITLNPPKNELNAFAFKRTQFPIKLCFSMTINKAQGQTLDFMGLYLPEPVFSHGQLYVAFSRVKNSKSIAVLIEPFDVQDQITNCTRNVVYKEVLRLANAHLPSNADSIIVE